MSEITNKKIALLMDINKVDLQELADTLKLTADETMEKLEGKCEWHTIEAVRVAKFFGTTIDEIFNDNSYTLRLRR